MKNFKQFLISFIGFLFMASIAVTAMKHAGTTTLAASVMVAGAVFLVAVSKRKSASHTKIAGVEVEMWAAYIIDRFWKDNKFLTRAFSDDDKVLGGKIVHIPQPGAAPVITKNRSSYPAAAVRRTDTDIVFALDEYTTAPTHIPNAEMVEPSYNKIDSVYGDHAGFLAEYVASDLILKWLDETVTSPTKLYTSGVATAGTAAAATGNRLAFRHQDLKAVQLKFNVDNVPQIGRQIMLESNMLDQFTSSLGDSQYRDFSQYYNAAEGVIGRMYGFDILDRSSVAVTNSANAIKALGAAGATGDNLVSVAWQKDCVTRAMGEVKFFENVGRAEYFGNIYSALMRMGARRRRADDKGIAAIIQSPSA